MQANMINQTLLDNWNGYSFDKEIVPDVGDYMVCPYFFLKRELDVLNDTWKFAKQNGLIRHCKITGNNKYFDYIVKKEYDTLEEWVTDANGKMEDILYGENRIHKRRITFENGRYVNKPNTPKYVALKNLLRVLGYTEPEPINTNPNTAIDNISELMARLLNRHELSLNNVWIIRDGTPIQWNAFFEN